MDSSPFHGVIHMHQHFDNGIKMGVAIFAKDCFGHPSPSNRQKLNATNHCLRRPSRPAPLVAYPTRGMQHRYAMTRRDVGKPAK